MERGSQVLQEALEKEMRREAHPTAAGCGQTVRLLWAPLVPYREWFGEVAGWGGGH